MSTVPPARLRMGDKCQPLAITGGAVSASLRLKRAYLRRFVSAAEIALVDIARAIATSRPQAALLSRPKQGVLPNVSYRIAYMQVTA